MLSMGSFPAKAVQELSVCFYACKISQGFHVQFSGGIFKLNYNHNSFLVLGTTKTVRVPQTGVEGDIYKRKKTNARKHRQSQI